MYLSTFCFTAWLVVATAGLTWIRIIGSDHDTTANAYAEQTVPTMNSDLTSSVFALFRAVEDHDNPTIYRYAAPWIKQHVPYKMFVSHQYPNWKIENIRHVISYSSVFEDIEQAVVIVSYLENGSTIFGAMRWRLDPSGAYYDTLPFGFSLLSDFSYFPPHLTRMHANEAGETTP